MKLKENLKKLMLADNLNMSDLARIAELKPQSIRGWFEADSMPRQKNIEKLATHFGCTSQELIYSQLQLPANNNNENNKLGDNIDMLVTDTIENILKEIIGMPEEGKQAILRQIIEIKGTDYFNHLIESSETRKIKKPSH